MSQEHRDRLTEQDPEWEVPEVRQRATTRSEAREQEKVQASKRQIQRNQKGLGGWWWLRQIVSWLVFLTITGLLLVMVVIPKASGATAYTVLTQSMSPGMPPGTLAVVKPVDPQELSTGDVITYQMVSGQPEVVTHRIVGVGKTLGGELRFTTRGDANGADDSQLVRAEQIRGSLWYSVPFLGFINSALTGQQRGVILLVAVTGLLGYAILMLISAARDKSGRNNSAPAQRLERDAAGERVPHV